MNALRFATECARRFGPTQRRRQSQAQRRENAAWLRDNLQKLGPTYVKLGQFVTSRGDVFDATVVAALEQLQDAVEPLPDATVREIITNSKLARGKAVRKFDVRPIASASIGQVHEATLRDGTRVAVKVRRPGVEEALSTDLAWLTTAVDFWGVVSDRDQARATRAILEDFRHIALEEANYMHEVANMTLYGRMGVVGPWPRFFNRPFRVPNVIQELCSEDVIVMEYVQGVKIGKYVEQLTKDARQRLAYDIMDVFIGKLFFAGIIHGDPHEGNLAVTPDGAGIVFYDFGNVITIDADLRRSFKTVMYEIIGGNIDAAVEALRDVKVVRIKDVGALRGYMAMYVEYLKTVDVSAFSISEQTSGVQGVIPTMPIELDGIVFRIMRAFTVVEGICKKIDPSFTYDQIFAKYMSVSLYDVDVLRYKARSDIGSFARQLTGWM